jgi:hypothetical protein
MDKKVIEKNKIKILIGLIAEFANKPFITSLKETQFAINIAIAPTAHIIQYVFKFIFLILILGKNNIEPINNIHVNIEIIIVEIIVITFLPKKIILL